MSPYSLLHPPLCDIFRRRQHARVHRRRVQRLRLRGRRECLCRRGLVGVVGIVREEDEGEAGSGDVDSAGAVGAGDGLDVEVAAEDAVDFELVAEGL